MSGRPLFASRLAYDALHIESGEDSDDDDQVQEEDVQEVSSEEPVKLSKSAIKKAQSLARKERRQQQKAQARAAKAAGGASPEAPLTPQTPETKLPEALPTPAAAPVALPKASEIPAEPSKVEVHPPSAKTSYGVHAAANGTSNDGESKVTEKPSVELSQSKTMKVSPQAPAVPAASVPVPAPQAPSPPSLEEGTTSTASTSTSTLPLPEEAAKKRQNVLERVVWTFIMIGGFIGLLLMGHAYMILLVMLCQTLVYREVTALFSLKSAADSRSSTKPDLKGKDPWSKTLNWYFFAVTNYFLYGESIIYYFKHVIFSDSQLLPFATNHRMISFTLYIIGFMGFVMSLKKGYLKQQFGLFCWVHMSLLIIVFSSHFIVNNILEGLIWFWVPASLVICNDCFAYIWGKLFGRTPLIKLSPKKTVEGFVGAFWSTVLFGVCWGTYFMRFSYMICPVHDLGTNAFNSIACKPNPVFVWQTIQLWSPLSTVLSTLTGKAITTMSYAPYQIHLLTLSTFASLVAPFGGFFASGFKRAFNIKDFGDSIPGHGGMTDRMDCQFLMGVFTYVYYSSLIRENHVTVGGILQTIVSGLSVDEQLELIADLTRYLEKQGIALSR